MTDIPGEAMVFRWPRGKQFHFFVEEVEFRMQRDQDEYTVSSKDVFLGSAVPL